MEGGDNPLTILSKSDGDKENLRLDQNDKEGQFDQLLQFQSDNVRVQARDKKGQTELFNLFRKSQSQDNLMNLKRADKIRQFRPSQIADQRPLSEKIIDDLQLHKEPSSSEEIDFINEQLLSFDIEKIFNSSRHYPQDEIEQNRKILFENSIDLLVDCRKLCDFLEMRKLEGNLQLKLIDWKILSKLFCEWSQFLNWILENCLDSSITTNASTRTSTSKAEDQEKYKEFMKSVSKFSLNITQLRPLNKTMTRSPNLRFHIDILEQMIYSGFKWSKGIWILGIENEGEILPNLQDKVMELTLELLIHLENNGIKFNSRPVYEMNLYYKSGYHREGAVSLKLTNYWDRMINDNDDDELGHGQKILCKDTFYGLNVKFMGWSLKNKNNIVDYDSLLELISISLKKQCKTLANVNLNLRKCLQVLKHNKSFVHYKNIKDEWKDYDLGLVECDVRRINILIQFVGQYGSDINLQNSIKSFETHFQSISKWIVYLVKFLSWGRHSSTEMNSTGGTNNSIAGTGLFKMKFQCPSYEDTIFTSSSSAGKYFEEKGQSNNDNNELRIIMGLEDNEPSKWKSFLTFTDFLHKNGQKGYYDSFCSVAPDLQGSCKNVIENIPSSLKDINLHLNTAFMSLYDTFDITTTRTTADADSSNEFTIVQSSLMAYSAYLIILENLEMSSTCIKLPLIVKNCLVRLLLKLKRQLRQSQAMLKELKAKIDTGMKKLDTQLYELVQSGAEFYYEDSFIQIKRKIRPSSNASLRLRLLLSASTSKWRKKFRSRISRKNTPIAAGYIRKYSVSNYNDLLGED